MPRHHGPRTALPSVVLSALLLALALPGCGKSLPSEPHASRIDVRHEAGIASSGRKDVILVTLRSDSDAGSLAESHGASLVANGWRVAGLKPGNDQTSNDLLGSLSTDSRVLTAEADAQIESAEMRQKSWAFDDGWGSPQTCQGQDATTAVGLARALLLSRGGGVRVAVLDGGAELAHPWIQGRIDGGWDFVDGDPDPSEAPDGIDNDGDGDVDEGWGHGTHVAGIIGIAAPDARLLIARVLDSEGRGDMLGLAQAIRWSVANGARVINLSLGSAWKSDAVKLAIDEANAAGVICVAAAGNTGTDGVEFPASYRMVIGVGAIDCGGKLASFSSFGSNLGICAPGVSIRSSFRNGGYALWSGTSMATPWVAGGAALLYARNPGWSRNQVVDRLYTTARSIWKENPSLRSLLGAGALDLGTALAVDSLAP
jgi:subtilisin family serine protease